MEKENGSLFPNQFGISNGLIIKVGLLMAKDSHSGFTDILLKFPNCLKAICALHPLPIPNSIFFS